MITGVEFWRMKSHLSVDALSKASAVATTTINNMERAYSPTALAGPYIRLSTVLGVSVDELVRDYTESLLEEGDRVTYRWKDKPVVLANCIACYRNEKNISLETLGGQLGVTRERARVLCKAETPNEKHVARLARREGVTEAVFHQRYDPKKEGNE